MARNPDAEGQKQITKDRTPVSQPEMTPSVVGPDQVGTAVEILVDAFYDDPVWSWAFPDALHRRDQHRVLWRAALDGAMRYPWVWLAPHDAAISVWIPPEGTELSAEQTDRFEPMLRDLLGAGADRVLETFEAFEHAHPTSVPHFYLSLLGTAPRMRGHGHGLALLADNLRTIDALGAPAYLESSNPANIRLYERYGFEVISTFAPPGGPDIAGMWRAPIADLTPAAR